MKKILIACTLVAVTTLGSLSHTQAGVIRSAQSAVINSGGPGFGSIDETFNQLGLSSNYISGVDDFDSYLTGGVGPGPINPPSHTLVFNGFEWFSAGVADANSPVVVTYDLGMGIMIDAMALWNEESSGIATMAISTSLNGTSFTTVASGITPVDNQLGLDYFAETFAFASSAARYVRLTLTGPQNPGDFPAVGVGEVAFRQSGVIPPSGTVPEPTSLALWGMGVVCLGLNTRRRRSL